MKTLSVAVVLPYFMLVHFFFVTLCCVFFQSHDPSMFGSRNKHAERSFSTPRVFTELETVTTSRSPMTVITDGEVQTNEEATVYVRELDIFLTMKLVENTPAVLSLGKLCDEQRYSYEWINGQKPHLIKNGMRIQCDTENFVPIVVPGLSSSSSSSSHPSTSMTPSRQECNQPASSSSSSTSPTMTHSSVSSESVARQERRDPYTYETPEELLNEPTEIPKPKKMRVTNRYTGRPVFRHTRMAARVQRKCCG